MSFRDDHDAALARADALERERDELAAKVKELEHDKTKPPDIRPSSHSILSDDPDRNDRTSTIWGFASAGVVAVAIVIIMIARSCSHSSDHADWETRRDARTRHDQRWVGLVTLEPCLHEVAWGTMRVRNATPDTIDRSKTSLASNPSSATANCYGRAAKLLGDDQTSAPMKTALARWIELQKSIEREAKSVDDDDANQSVESWKPLRATLERQAEAFAAMRRDVVPAVRAEMRAILEQHAKTSGRDDTYWRVALTISLHELVDVGFAASGIYDGKPPDLAAAAAALAQPTTKFLALANDAPGEVRRDLRELAWATGPFAAGQVPPGADPLWYLHGDEDKLIGGRTLIPARPPDPGPEPEAPSYGD